MNVIPARQRTALRPRVVFILLLADPMAPGLLVQPMFVSSILRIAFNVLVRAPMAASAMIITITRLTAIAAAPAVVTLALLPASPALRLFIQTILAVLERTNATPTPIAKMAIPALIIGAKDRLTRIRFAIGTI